MPLTIIAQIVAAPGKMQHVSTELQKLVAPTRAEAGCIQYDLHQDNEDPAVFVFFEIWESRALWQDHMNSEHIRAYGEATSGAISHFALNEMTHIA